MAMATTNTMNNKQVTNAMTNNERGQKSGLPLGTTPTECVYMYWTRRLRRNRASNAQMRRYLRRRMNYTSSFLPFKGNCSFCCSR